MIFALAEILSLKELRQADDLRAAPGGVGHALKSFLQIFFRLRSTRHLHQSYSKFVRGHAQNSFRIQYSRQIYRRSGVLPCDPLWLRFLFLSSVLRMAMAK